jgi:hypothetical protein
MKNEIVVDGVTYVKKVTEAPKRGRKKYFINNNNEVLAFTSDGLVIGSVGFYVGSPLNASELFDGDIVISKEEFDLAVYSLDFHIPAGTYLQELIKKLKQELFK